MGLAPLLADFEPRAIAIAHTRGIGAPKSFLGIERSYIKSGRDVLAERRDRDVLQRQLIVTVG